MVDLEERGQHGKNDCGFSHGVISCKSLQVTVENDNITNHSVINSAMYQGVLIKKPANLISSRNEQRLIGFVRIKAE